MILDKIFNPVRQLAEHGKLSGVLLIIATGVSLLLSNSHSAASYLGLWNSEIGFSFLHKSLLHWINDGLMPIFFLLVGIEIKREMVTGELSQVKQAVLPVFAAIGGILVPAYIFYIFNMRDAETLHGWAIPTATDIAFSLGILSLLGNRVPFAVKVFLTALAIIDDLGAILIIAIFYSGELQVTMILLALAVLVLMILFNRFNVDFPLIYLLLGGLLWYFTMKSGIHPTIAGVLTAFAIPAKMAEELEYLLDKPVYYFILPLFALANTAFPISFELTGSIFSGLSMGIILGLFLGKPIGILLATVIMIRSGFSTLPTNTKWSHLAGMGLTAGIGFTMSIFIASLSYSSPLFTNSAKLAILVGSLLSAVAGAIVLRLCPKVSGE
jgi:NhaA family Na+:H+ antiporter